MIAGVLPEGESGFRDSVWRFPGYTVRSIGRWDDALLLFWCLPYNDPWYFLKACAISKKINTHR